MDYADIYLCNFTENNHDRNEIDLNLQKHLLLFAYKILHIPTACLAY